MADATSVTTQQNAISAYAQPYVENLLGKAQALTESPYQAYPGQRTAEFTDLQNKAFTTAQGLQTPSQYDVASNLAGISALGALGTTGQAQQYGDLARMYGRQGMLSGMGGQNLGQMGANLGVQQGLGYGAQGAQAGQAGQTLGTLGGGAYGAMGAGYGAQGAGYGQQGANIGASLGQQSTSPYAVQAYMSPYLQQALAPQIAEANRQFDIGATKQQGAATQAGAFGGSREAIMAAENERNRNMALQNIVGQGYNQAFQNAQQQMLAANQAALAGNAQALQGAGLGIQGAGYGLQGVNAQLAGTAQGMQGAGYGLQGLQAAQAGIGQGLQGYGMGLQGAQAGMQGAGLGLQGIGAQQAGYGQAAQTAGQLANIGGQQLSAQQNILNLQNQLGTQQQQQQQNILNQQYQDFLMQKQYPYNQLSYMQSMLSGLPLQSTVQNVYSNPSLLSQVAGLGTAAAGAYGLANMGNRIGVKKGGAIKEKQRPAGLAELALHKMG